MTDDQLDAYAGQLAEAVMISTGDPGLAASVLFQAAGAVLISSFGPEMATQGMELLVADGVVAIGKYFGAGQVRQ